MDRPLGEQVFWVRPHDEKMYWYTGGNPRSVKSIKSSAYFMFSERSVKDLNLAFLSFKAAFEGKKVKKILCTNTDINDVARMGFSSPEPLDIERIGFFNKKASKGQERVGKLQIYLRYDLRFLAKLSIGVAYSLFGHRILETKYMQELYKALWYRERNDNGFPEVRGTSAYTQKNIEFNELCGMKNAVTITILQIKEGIAINLNICTKQNWTVMCAEVGDIDNSDIQKLGEGLCVVLFKTLNKGVELSLPRFLAHKNGNIPHPELTEIESKANMYPDYFKHL